MEPSDDACRSSSGPGRELSRTRPTKRSRKGCPECRRRKIKCDERRPRCGQCRKRDIDCHLQDSVFKQHTFSSGPVAITGNPWVTPASEEQFTSPSALEGATIESEWGLSNVRSEGETSWHAVSSVTEGAVCSPTGQSHRANHVTRVLLPDEDQSQPLGPPPGSSPIDEDESFHLPINTRRHQDLGSIASPLSVNNYTSLASTVAQLKDTQEELFLLRHYSECIAPWMDLLYRYEVFSREVLTLAREHPILRYAACAVAAKQLGQMNRPASTLLRGKTQERIADRLVRNKVGFVWYGIKFYEKAIQTLVKSITPKEPLTTQSAEPQASPAVSLSRGDLMIRAEGEDPIVRLLGTCILIQYEHLSANRDAWSGHLTGFSKLLDLIEDGRLLQPYPMFEQVYPWTKDIMALKAGFWNFVVNDLEESFVSHRKTRIDTENLSLWRNMGLLVEDDGSLTLTSGPNSLSATPEHARDKILSYTLIRLLCKLVDYLAPPSQEELVFLHSEPGDVVLQNKASFINLERHFDEWSQMLSPSFHPDGTFFADETPNGEDLPGLFGRELWFSNDLCSTTMMYYHMARVLLLIHRPSDLLSTSSSNAAETSFDLLRFIRAVDDKLQLHASEVIAIVRGTPCDAVKLRAIQPLYVAGRCCKGTRERKLLVEMLTDIQDNLGIATGYRIKSLLHEWGTSYQDFGMEERLTAEEQLP